MSFWGHVLFPIIGLLMAGMLVLAYRVRDEDFLRCILLGTIGGTLGTIGYDLFRIPFHHLGLNLLSPVRAYGIWLSGAQVSSYWTDFIGFSYHISNGITFGWIYAMVAHRRTMWWALLWALSLETLAVVTVFGAVFGLQQYSNAVLLAYIAHLFYGWPLGVICEDKPLPADAGVFSKFWNRNRVSGVVILTLLVGAWFMTVRPAGSHEINPGTIQIGPNRVLPTWSDLEQGGKLLVQNKTGKRITVGIRQPGPDGHFITEHEIDPDSAYELTLKESGIYQVQTMDHPEWRSVFLGVNKQGDYRTR